MEVYRDKKGNNVDANEAGSVPSNVGTQLPQNAESSSRSVMGFFKLIFAHKAISIITLVLLVIIGVAIFAGQKLYQANKATSPVASRFDDQKIPLGSAVAPGALQLNTSQALSINGQLRANNTLVLSPSTQPTRGTAGQLYYDSTTSRILYHNGQAFVAVADTTRVDQLQVQLQSTASQAEVASLAQQLQELQAQLGQIQIPTNVAQLDAVNNFSAQNTFAAGLSAANLSVSGATALGSTTAASLVLSNPLGVVSGGTGQTSLPLNGVLIGQGTSPVAAVTAGAAGQCLISTAGAPVFQACPGGSGGVDSLNGLSGALTLANASAAGSTITIDDATTASKGIASFNATNFSVVGGAVNTVQNISVASVPTFAGLTLNGDLNIGANNIVTSGGTIGSAELSVLDGGITESEVTGVITDVTAGNGLTGGAASGNATLNIASANGGIAVNADNIALTLQPTGDALSSTTASGSGLEILAGGLSLLQGCADGQVLKWNEATDTWGCATDAGSGGLGDDITVNGAAVTDANFIDTVASGSSAGVAWTINTTPSPDDISLTISNASATQAGVVTTGVQSFAGDKTFNNAATITGLFTANGGVTIETGDTFTINGDGFTDLTGTGLMVTAGVLQTTLGTTIDSSEITDLTVTGADIANDTITLGTKTTGDYQAGTAAGTGLVVTGTAGEGWTPTVSLDYSGTLASNSLGVNQSSFAATGILFEGSTSDAFETLFTLANPTSDNTITLPDASGTVCLSSGNCPAGGNVSTSGGTVNTLAKFTSGQNIENSTITDDGTNVTTSVNLIVQGGNVTAGTNAQLGSFILHDGNGQTTTLRAGDSAGNLTLTLPTSAGSQFQCLKYDTGGQLIWDNCDGGSGGGSGVTSLNGLAGDLALQGSTQIGVSAASPNINLSINADSIGDGQLAFNTGQHLTTTSAPTFAGLTLNGDLTVGTNNIVTGVSTISSTELDVLDGGITESEVTGVITDVTAGNGLTGGAASGNATLNVASANGGIVVGADNIALTLQPTGDALSSTTSSGSGLEILSTGLSLIQGCSDGQILKWNEATDTWGCSDDAGGSGVGDDVFINGSNADGAKFIDSAATGSSAGTVWNLNTTPSPDEITLTVSNASATEAGVVTTGVQSFAGDKTFNNAVTITGLFTANGGITMEAGDTFTFNGDAFTDFTGTGLTISGGALQTTLGTSIESSEITDLTITGGDIANDAIGDAQLAFNTGQHLTVSSSPSFAGITLTGNLSIGANSIVTNGATIESTELDVLDGGINESEVTGAITDVTAGNGLTGGAASGNATLNIVSANGGIVVNADNIALVLQPTGDALSSTTSSGSGLEILSGGFALLQGCSDNQVLKWNETADTWGCSDDAGGSGLGDDISVNGSAATNANFIDTVASGSTAGVTWNLNTTPSPDEIAISISNASATQAGAVTTSAQAFAGLKTFNGGVASSSIRAITDSTTAIQVQNASGSSNILTVDTTNGRIGIGTTPSYKLHVADTTTADSGTNNTGAFFSYTVNPSSAPAGITTYYGQQTLNTSSSANLNGNVTMYGDVSTVQNAGNATLGAAVGTGAVAQNAGAGVITNAIGARFKASNTGTGSITNGVAIQASTPEVTAGSIGTAYGLFIETQDVSGVGTGYGIWQAGADDLNVFAGKVGIGMVPSAHALEVNGTGLFGTSVLTQTIDTYSAVALNVGTANATQINLNKNVVVAANQSLTITGGATGTRPASPTEGMVYFDTTTKQLLTYANGKWQADRTESIVVAASNGTQAEKDAADYVATGTGDQTVINNALTAASGKKVMLLAGTFTVDASVQIPSNTTLEGVGNGTVITIPNGHNADINVITNATPAGGNTGIILSNLRIEGNKTNNTAGIQVGIKFTTSSGSNTRITIDRVQSNNFRHEGLYLYATDYAKVVNSTFQGSQYGIHAAFSRYGTWSDNVISASTAHGVWLDTGTSELSFSGNNVQGTTGTGLRISSVNNTVAGNNFSGNANVAISIENHDNTVSGNNLSNNGGSGGGDSLAVSGNRNTITGNTITDTAGTGYAIRVLAGATANYLTGNTYSGTGATAITDLGTNTVLGGQVKDNANGNYYIQPAGTIELTKNTNVTGDLAATGTLQGTQLISTVATGTAPLTVNSTTLVANLNTDLLDGQHGSFYQDASNINAGTLAVSRGGTGAGSFTQYGILFGNGTGAFGVTAAGSTGQCLLATTSAAPTWGACASVSLQGAYDTSSGSPLITLTDNKDFSITAPDTATDSSIVFNLNCTTCSANGGRFAIQDAGVDIFRVNPNGDIIIGTSTNNVTLAAAAGYEPILNGTARHPKKLVLTAEYIGTVLDTASDTAGRVAGVDGTTVNCNANNSGTMISGYENSGRMNYYRWLSTQTTTQCYDVVVQVPIPSDWAAWAASDPVNIQARTDNASNTAVHIQILDSSNAVDGNYDYSNPTLTTSWADIATSSFASSNYTAGDYMTVKIRMSSKNSSGVRIGNITLNYMSKY